MKHKSSTIATLFVVVVVAIAALSTIGLLATRPSSIRLQGTIEAPETRIAGKLTGRVAHIYVVEGQSVRKGDTLIAIHSPEAEAKYTQALSLQRAAQEQSRKADNGAPSEAIEAAREVWLGAKAQRELAEATYRKIERLASEGVITPQRREETFALYRTALAAENAAYQQYILLHNGTLTTDRMSALYVADAAAGTTEEVSAILLDSHLLAPTDGTISEIYPGVGELVVSGAPLLAIVDLAAPYVVVNVREDRMPHFRLGGHFDGSVPAIGDGIVGWEINFVAPLGDYATWRTAESSTGYDMRTFEVHAKPTTEVAYLRPGMSVIIEIEGE